MNRNFLNKAVFYPSVGIIVLITIISLAFQDFSTSLFKSLQNIIAIKLGWFYVLSVAIIFFGLIVISISSFGKIRLGPDHSRAKYTNGSWFAMLFSAGMGIGLLFFGVAEPLMHFLNPPVGDASTMSAAKNAMNITFFHWGLHAWAIYAFVALILAYFGYRHQLPLTLRSAFFPLIGDRIYGSFGNSIDVFAVIATLFGVATSLGYGALQINSGLNYLFGLPINAISQAFLIVFVTALAILSATSGLDKGIKILSNTNMILAVIFLLLLLVLGDTVGLLRALVQNTGTYFSTFIANTFNLYAYTKGNDGWLGGWTLLYWAWWLSWSPFVGLFIARISKGRTIREFVVGVLLVPAGFTFIWMSFFGNSAIKMVQNGNETLAKMVNQDVSASLFYFLEQFPFSTALSIVAVCMIVVFFVTSADSASMVLDMLCSNGKDDTPRWQKVFWGGSIGVVAAALMFVGGLKALQSMTLVSALPFTIALLVAGYGFVKALRVDTAKKESQTLAATPSRFFGDDDWRERLEAVILFPSKRYADRFFWECVTPTFQELSDEFQKYQLEVKIENGDKSTHSLCVALGDEDKFTYGIKLLKDKKPPYAKKHENDEFYYRAEVFLNEGGQGYDVLGWSQDMLRSDIIEQYRRHLHFLHLLR